jgi:hypothetical protein
MFTIADDIAPAETQEAFLKRWLTLDKRRVPLVAVVRHLEETPREDVAYILREHKRGGRGRTDGPQMLIAFLKAYDPHRLECQIYREEEMPFAFECPQALLSQLDTTTDPLALHWRAQCWQRLLQPLADGDTIAFQAVVPGIAKPPGTPLRVEFVEGAPVFVELQGQQRCRVPLWRMFPYDRLGSLHVQLAGGALA